jgi:hypothetical protein
MKSLRAFETSVNCSTIGATYDSNIKRFIKDVSFQIPITIRHEGVCVGGSTAEYAFGVDHLAFEKEQYLRNL